MNAENMLGIRISLLPIALKACVAWVSLLATPQPIASLIDTMIIDIAHRFQPQGVDDAEKPTPNIQVNYHIVSLLNKMCPANPANAASHIQGCNPNCCSQSAPCAITTLYCRPAPPVALVARCSRETNTNLRRCASVGLRSCCDSRNRPGGKITKTALAALPHTSRSKGLHTPVARWRKSRRRALPAKLGYLPKWCQRC